MPWISELAGSLLKGKETKDQAGYQGPDQGPFKCAHCEYFIAPSACSKVSGPIAPEGCCNNYQKK